MQPKTSQLLRQVALYTCALVLPLIAISVTEHMPSLSSVPFAFSMVVVAALGIVAGPGPAIVAVVVTFLYENLRSKVVLAHTSDLGSLERRIVLIGAAALVLVLSWKKSSSERRLRATLKALEEQKDSLLQAQRASHMATWFFRADTRETLWDAGAFPVFGRPFEDLPRHSLPLGFVHDEDREGLRTSFEDSIRTGDPVAAEFRVVWPNNETHWLETRGTRLADQPGCWRGVTLDITRRKVIETALIRSEKLAAMGRLASTVAHEVNNPLESVTNILYLVGSETDLSPTVRSYLTLAEEEIARLANITRLTLTFARPNSLRTTVNISEVLDDVLNIYQRRCESLGVAVERFYTPELSVEIQPHELRQIAINLIANALDALNTDERRLRLRTFREGDRATFCVEDSGAGIPASDLPHVFDAFFTTKSDVGTGIGLWVTHELVAKNGGTITVDSGNLEDHFHTRFCVTLPIGCPDLVEAKT